MESSGRSIKSLERFNLYMTMKTVTLVSKDELKGIYTCRLNKNRKLLSF